MTTCSKTLKLNIKIKQTPKKDKLQKKIIKRKNNVQDFHTRLHGSILIGYQLTDMHGFRYQQYVDHG